jgi:hypothetical protein
MFDIEDKKSKRPIRALSRQLCGRTDRLIETYLAELGTELLPDAPMFRNQAGTSYSKDALWRSLRKVLKAAALAAGRS